MGKAKPPRKQCAKCPWKVSTNPHEIPGEYTVEKHKNLIGTVATGLDSLGRTLRLMACHETNPGKELVCVGWLVNQIENNNLGVRLAVMQGRIDGNVETVGEQHARIEDTLPKENTSCRKSR